MGRQIAGLILGSSLNLIKISLAKSISRTIMEKLRELEISTVNTRKAWTDEKYGGEKITAELNRYISNVDNLSRTIQRKETLRGNLHVSRI